MEKMSTGFPSDNIEQSNIYYRTLSLIADTDAYVLPEKKSHFKLQVDKYHKKFKMMLGSPEIEKSQALLKYVTDVANEFRRGSNGNWQAIEAVCTDLRRAQERLVRRSELQHPRNKASFTSALRWIVDRGHAEDLELLLEIKTSPPFTSEEITLLLDLVEPRILNRARIPFVENPWIAECAQSRSIDRDEELSVLSEILRASQQQVYSLKELAQKRECRSIFRRAAVKRLVQLAPDQATLQLLRGLYDRSEPDEDLRVRSYEAYRYLRVLTGSPLDAVEKAQDKKDGSSDPSPRMRWLMSLDD